MADTTFAPGTVIKADWLQDVNDYVYAGPPSGSYVDLTSYQTITNKTFESSNIWNGSTIQVHKGGTGQTNYAVGDMLYATGTVTLARLARGTNGQILSTQATVPTWIDPPVSGSGTNNEVILTDYGAVADFIPATGGGGSHTTDNATAFISAYNTGQPIYIPAGNYYLTNTGTTGDGKTPYYALEYAQTYGPGKLWGLAEGGVKKIPLGFNLRIGSNISHEASRVGGLVIGGQYQGHGMKLWAGHHNWMQFMPTKYGGIGQVQVYGSHANGLGTSTAPDKINGTFPTYSSHNYCIEVGDWVSFDGIDYLVTANSGTQLTVTTTGGGSPGLSTSAIQRPWSHCYETASGYCDVSGPVVTYNSGEIFPVGYVAHGNIRIDGVLYPVTAISTNYSLIITGTATKTNVPFFLKRGEGPFSYQSLFRLQGNQGGYETNGYLSLNARNETVLANNASSYEGAEGIRLEIFSKKMAKFGTTETILGAKLAPDNTTAHTSVLQGKIACVGLGTSESLDGGFGDNYVLLGKQDTPTMKVIDWGYTDYLTIYGSTSGVNTGPTIAAEGATTNLDITLTPKGSGGIILNKKTTINDFTTTGLTLSTTATASFGILISSSSVDQIDKGIAFATRCTTAGIAMGGNKINLGASSSGASASTSGDLMWDGTAGRLFFNQSGTLGEILVADNPLTETISSNRTLRIKVNGVTYKLLAAV